MFKITEMMEVCNSFLGALIWSKTRITILRNEVGGGLSVMYAL